MALRKTFTLHLDENERVALQSALDNYLNGIGMDDVDEDEPVIAGLLAALAGEVL